MRVIIAGSRTMNDYNQVLAAVHDSGFTITKVICGMARGADMLGHTWAMDNRVPVSEFPADWNKHGRRAGYLRNLEMAENADAVILIWDGRSLGSAMMKKIALDKGLQFHERIVDCNPEQKQDPRDFRIGSGWTRYGGSGTPGGT
jgi:hypothetical protein